MKSLPLLASDQLRVLSKFILCRCDNIQSDDTDRSGVKGLKVHKLPESARLRQGLAANQKKMEANQKNLVARQKVLANLNVIGYFQEINIGLLSFSIS